MIIFLFASSKMPLTWDEGEVSRRSDELPVKWSGTIDQEGHPQLPIFFAAAGKIILSDKYFSKKFRLRFISLFFVSISFTVLFYRLKNEFDLLTAWFSIISILLIPHLFALLLIAVWDSCLIASWICCLAFFPKSLDKTKDTVIFGFCLGLAFSSKFSGFVIPIPFAVWSIIILLSDKLPSKVVIFKRIFIVTIISFCTFFIFNPPFWSDPIFGIIRFFYLNIYREINIPIMFLGRIYDLYHPLPFYNTFFWTIITIPLGLFFFFIVGCYSILFRLNKRNENLLSELTKRRFGLLLILNFIVLLLIRMLPNMPVHDGTRLFVGSYVFLGIISGIGATIIWRSKKIVIIFASKNILSQVITIMIFAVSLFNIFWYYPQWLSFYNFAVGGLSGAVKIGMEATYYWDGFDNEVIEWLNENTGKDELILFSKFSPDTFLIYREDGVLLPEFYMSSKKYDDKKNNSDNSDLDLDSDNSDLDKASRIRFYVTQNRAGLQNAADKFFKTNSQPVYVKTIRKGGYCTWNIETVPIIEIYDIKSIKTNKKRNNRSVE
ncbi:MAG: glycosyltransferase family 39 protein [Planctomycetaceae bacterium]|nr:glycosyltransferase family 39 protein [Planctomycetaceae bacterium]